MDTTLGKATVTTVTQLKWEHRDGDLLITPSDQDRFMVKIGKAIEILRQYERHKQFENQFNVLLKRLASWLDSHQDQWERAFLTAGESTLRFIVVRKQVRFQPEITDALSGLGIEIANDPDLDLIQLSTRALPLASEESLQSFLDSSFTIEFDGDRAGSHRTSEQEP
jgi:hypothetical protein